ncbi:hypothetical protein VNI00_014805 [Paramarasmius palmivorus]|uniref:Uncharacterized protein n=1 Tax=Paramarasmius palmivorus TaxID=297713 RepID=A0AAW0BRU0_9AGAR
MACRLPFRVLGIEHLNGIDNGLTYLPPPSMTSNVAGMADINNADADTSIESNTAPVASADFHPWINRNPFSERTSHPLFSDGTELHRVDGVLRGSRAGAVRGLARGHTLARIHRGAPARAIALPARATALPVRATALPVRATALPGQAGGRGTGGHLGSRGQGGGRAGIRGQGGGRAGIRGQGRGLAGSRGQRSNSRRGVFVSRRGLFVSRGRGRGASGRGGN